MQKFISLLLIVSLIACSKVPITGRKQLSIIPNAQILPLSYDSYSQVLNESQLSDDQEKVQLVKTVGNKTKNAVIQFMNDNKLSDKLDGYEWEFNLIDEDVANAWCMPGGKVAFYTGILPICQDESGIAVVMGHEIAHAIANHGRERMSQGLVQQLGGMALTVAIQDKPEQTQAIFNTAYAVGTIVGAMLPFSRLHESEADKLGLIFMAMAGYDPHEAIDFWKRMDAMSAGNQPPAFLSTHPSHEKRIADLEAYLPKAMKYYKKGQKKRTGNNIKF